MSVAVAMTSLGSTVVPTPQQWLLSLENRLTRRRAVMEEMDGYYRGDHPLPFITPAHYSKVRDEFRRLLEESRTNFMRLVVDAVEERLSVEGVRLSASKDVTSDGPSWEVWQASGMDAEAQVAMVEALVKGVSYLSVWPHPDLEKPPVITVEDPMEVIVGYVPGTNFRLRAAALKLWKDEWTGLDRANVYMPGGIFKYAAVSDETVTEGEVSATGPQDTFGITDRNGSQRYGITPNVGLSRWQELPEEFVPMPLNVQEVPIVPLRNRPRLLVEGESELADVYRVQNQINGFLFLLALAGYFGAHRQRWATGIKLMKDERTGQPLEPIDTAIDKLWTNENPEGRFGDFSETSLDGYIKAIEQKVLHIAVTTRTPRHYLIEQGQSPSGDAIKSAESGLTRKVARKQRPFGECFEEVLRIARRFMGEEETPPDSEVVWASPEITTEAEKTDAAIKKVNAGLITREQALEDLGYTQTQIARMLEQEPPTPTPAPPPADTPPEGGNPQ